jgi:hypothetical protein
VAARALLLTAMGREESLAVVGPALRDQSLRFHRAVLTSTRLGHKADAVEWLTDTAENRSPIIRVPAMIPLPSQRRPGYGSDDEARTGSNDGQLVRAAR